MALQLEVASLVSANKLDTVQSADVGDDLSLRMITDLLGKHADAHRFLGPALHPPRGSIGIFWRETGMCCTRLRLDLLDLERWLLAVD